VLPAKSHRTVREILTAWYSTSDRLAVRLGRPPRPLIACSGGADSSALVLALGTLSSRHHRPGVAHIVHDLRSPQECEQDARATSSLSEAAGLGPCEMRSVAVRQLAGNQEANARRCRYDALATIAVESQFDVVLTGHTKNDQAESVLLALLRGASTRGLRGMLPLRQLSTGTPLIYLARPMLATTRIESEELCEACNLSFCIDATNANIDAARTYTRHVLMAALGKLNTQPMDRLVEFAALQRQLHRMIGRQARQVRKRATISADGSLCWPTVDLAALDTPVLHTVLTQAMVSFSGVMPSARRDQLVAFSCAVAHPPSRHARFRIGGCIAMVTPTLVTFMPISAQRHTGRAE